MDALIQNISRLLPVFTGDNIQRLRILFRPQLDAGGQKGYDLSQIFTTHSIENAVRLRNSLSNFGFLREFQCLCFGDNGINIANMINKSRGDVAYTMMDVESVATPEIVETLKAIDGVFRVRVVKYVLYVNN